MYNFLHFIANFFLDEFGRIRCRKCTYRFRILTASSSLLLRHSLQLFRNIFYYLSIFKKLSATPDVVFDVSIDFRI